MRTSYSLDLRQLLELLEDICSSDLERPVQIASTPDGGMEMYLAPENGKVLLQVDVVSLQGAESSKSYLMPLQTSLHGMPVSLSAPGQSDGWAAILARPNATDMLGKTALHIAAEQGQSDTCAAILARPDFSNVNAQDSLGSTALHVAASKRLTDVCAAILARPDFSELNAKDQSGQTAFDLAVSRDLGDACDILAFFRSACTPVHRPTG